MHSKRQGASLSKSRGEIWAHLSVLDISNHTETNKLAGTTYLPWHAAHAILMDAYASDYSWRFESTPEGSNFFRYPDGTGEVRCTMSICGHETTVSQVVTTAASETSDKYLPAVNPNASQIHNAKMRARVRCAAEGFGLGFSLWEKDAEPREPMSDDGQDTAGASTPKIDEPRESIRELFERSVGSESSLKAATERYTKMLGFIEQTGGKGKDEVARLFEELLQQKGWAKPTKKGGSKK